MLGRDKILECLSKAVRCSPADATIISVYKRSIQTTRFSNERIHQNIQNEDISVYIKVVRDNRCGISVTNSIHKERLKNALAAAINIAKVSPKNPRMGELAKGADRHPCLETYFPQTHLFEQSHKIDIIKKAFVKARLKNLTLAGSFLNGEDEMAVVNSQGVCMYQPFSIASIKFIPICEKHSGFGQAVNRDILKLDISGALDTAINKAMLSRCLPSKDISLGSYPCILEPEAVAEILMWLGYIGFGAKLFNEHRSFIYGRIGDRLMNASVTILDDGFNQEGLALPFDFEGFSRKRTMLIKRGVACGIVYDSSYAAIYGRSSTGHALPPNDTEGPLPLNLFINHGKASKEDMVKSLALGILVTRFHYVNGYLNPKEALMTGLTRDGTFLIQNGKIKAAVKNLRFTQSMLEAFSNIKLISNERKLIADPSQEMGACVVPSLLIEKFNFTGKTE